jgi:hypothetical protein
MWIRRCTGAGALEQTLLPLLYLYPLDLGMWKAQPEQRAEAGNSKGGTSERRAFGIQWLRTAEADAECWRPQSFTPTSCSVASASDDSSNCRAREEGLVGFGCATPFAVAQVTRKMPEFVGVDDSDSGASGNSLNATSHHSAAQICVGLECVCLGKD